MKKFNIENANVIKPRYKKFQQFYQSPVDHYRVTETTRTKHYLTMFFYFILRFGKLRSAAESAHM